MRKSYKLKKLKVKRKGVLPDLYDHNQNKQEQPIGKNENSRFIVSYSRKD